MNTATAQSKADQRLNELADIVRRECQQVAQQKDVGPIQETLKWNQLSFLPKRPRTGTTVRIDQHDDTHVALYVHCQTSLVDTFRSLFPELTFQGNRAVLFDVRKALPAPTIRLCVRAALRYHLDK